MVIRRKWQGRREHACDIAGITRSKYTAGIRGHTTGCETRWDTRMDDYERLMTTERTDEGESEKRG